MMQNSRFCRAGVVELLSLLPPTLHLSILCSATAYIYLCAAPLKGRRKGKAQALAGKKAFLLPFVVLSRDAPPLVLAGTLFLWQSNRDPSAVRD
jgi:hypothetical protein